MKNFNQAMQASAQVPEYNASVFIRNDFITRHNYELQLQEQMRHPIMVMMSNIMYLHQALQQQDAAEFVKAVVKEVNSHIKQYHWRLIEHNKVSEGMDLLPAIWAMCRKQILTTNAITKYKARLNINGGKQEYGVIYYKTYIPVVTWFAIRLVIVFAILFGWALCQV
ncbi:hypothetical protein ACHAXS_000677, partial [Conticribra weissflogii]